MNSNPLNIVPDELPHLPYIPLTTEDSKTPVVNLFDVDEFDGKNVFITFNDGSFKAGYFELRGELSFTIGHSEPLLLTNIVTIRET